MLERSGDPRLSDQVVAHRRRAAQLGLERLERHIAGERRLVGEMHDTHPAGAEQRVPNERRPARVEVTRVADVHTRDLGAPSATHTRVV